MIYRVFSAEADFKQAHPPLDAALLLPPEFLSARLQRDVSSAGSCPRSPPHEAAFPAVPVLLSKVSVHRGDPALGI